MLINKRVKKNTWCGSASIHWVALKCNLSFLSPCPSVPGEKKPLSFCSPTVAVSFSGAFLSVSQPSLTSLLETAFFHTCLMYYWEGDSVLSSLSMCGPKGSLKDLFKRSTWEGKGGKWVRVSGSDCLELWVTRKHPETRYTLCYRTVHHRGSSS